METTFRSVFLTSEKPEATALFYERVTGMRWEAVGDPSEYRYWRSDHGGIQLAVHDAKLFAEYAHPPLPGSNLTHLYFTISSLDEFIARLEQLGITPLLRDEVVITVLDPDGRHVMFGTA